MNKLGRIKNLPGRGSVDAMRLASSEERNELGTEISSLYILALKGASMWQRPKPWRQNLNMRENVKNCSLCL
jgi:hypothetical protein